MVIVGQGLAGTLLAWELVRRGQRVLLMDAGAADGTSPQLLPPATNRRWLFAKHIVITVIMLFSNDATYRAHRQRVPPLVLQQEQGLQGRGQPGRGGQGWLLPLPLRSLQTPAHGDLSKGKA